MATKKPQQKSGLAQVEKNQKRQQRALGDLQRKEQWMKWLIIGLFILVLLLILFFGYATDWTKGLRKDNAAVPTSSELDSAKTADGTGTNATNTTNPGSTSRTSNGTNTNTGSTARETTNTSTTTTTNNTTNTTTPAPGGAIIDLRGLLDGISVGDNINEILDLADLLPGVSISCHNELLIQVCEISDGSITISTKNLLGTGIVTSITNNL